MMAAWIELVNEARGVSRIARWARRRRRSSSGSWPRGCRNLRPRTSWYGRESGWGTAPGENASPASGINRGDTVGATSMPVDLAGALRCEGSEGSDERLLAIVAATTICLVLASPVAADSAATVPIHGPSQVPMA